VTVSKLYAMQKLYCFAFGLYEKTQTVGISWQKLTKACV